MGKRNASDTFFFLLSNMILPTKATKRDPLSTLTALRLREITGIKNIVNKAEDYRILLSNQDSHALPHEARHKLAVIKAHQKARHQKLSEGNK